jgi:hypothetical protein
MFEHCAALPADGQALQTRFTSVQDTGAAKAIAIVSSIRPSSLLGSSA